MTLELPDAVGGRSRAGTNSRSDGGRLRWDDPLLYVLVFVVGLVPVVAVAIHGGAWGAEPTIGVLFCVLSAVALVRGAYRTHQARSRAYGGK